MGMSATAVQSGFTPMIVQMATRFQQGTESRLKTDGTHSGPVSHRQRDALNFRRIKKNSGKGAIALSRYFF
jgi:hypothetical protein